MGEARDVFAPPLAFGARGHDTGRRMRSCRRPRHPGRGRTD